MYFSHGEVHLPFDTNSNEGGENTYFFSLVLVNREVFTFNIEGEIVSFLFLTSCVGTGRAVETERVSFTKAITGSVGSKTGKRSSNATCISVTYEKIKRRREYTNIE